MKGLIIHRPQAGQVFKYEKNFNQMVMTLQKGGISARYVPLSREMQLIDTLAKEPVDIAFSADYYLVGHGNEKVNIHALFEELNLPYIGSSPEVLELVLSKSKLKQVWQKNGISTPQYFLARREETAADLAKIIARTNNYPYILKPDAEGNSRGLSEACVVYDRESLNQQLTTMLEIYPSILAEQFLGAAPDLREFTVAMLGNGEGRLALPARIQLKKKKSVRVITTRDKDEHNTMASAVGDEALKEKLIEFSRKAFAAAGVRDYARCDVLYANGEFHAIEINGQPMIPDKWFEACCKDACLDGDQYQNAIFLAGIVRNRREGKMSLPIPAEMRECLPPPVYAALTLN